MRNEISKASLLFLSIMVVFGMLISAQPNDEQKVLLDQVKVPLSKPGQPVFVQVSNREGNIKVMGTDGQEVIVETYGQQEDSSRGARESGRKSEGLRLIRSASSSLEIEEENNKVRIEPGSGMEGLDLVIKVPRQCSLNLSSSDGDIVAENVSGDLEVESTDGDVVLKGISGSVVASSADGDVTVVLNAVTPGKPMSFSTVDGDVDVTLPSDIKAIVKLKTVEGDIYTDFAVNLQPTLNKKEEKRGNVYRLETDRIMTGTINGGGPEYKFYSLEGDIYLRQKK